jgi:HTH-type transcriptional regulator/antitoxin HigA
MQALMDELLAEVGDDEDHPLADLLDVVGALVGQYEDEHTAGLSAVRPIEVLKFLMEQHGLKQSDLRKEVGTQGVVSEILSGTRKINARQAKSLAKRFGVSPVVFL